ncbi:hypothetical protein GQ600_17733 [Phytophthora cactorum]|nr:hypothetical protein GQ600_17733 [Phytophthora cactorum]
MVRERTKAKLRALLEYISKPTVTAKAIGRGIGPPQARSVVCNRVSNKLKDNRVRRLDPAPGMPMRGVQDKEGIFAFAWTPIFEQDVEDPDRQDQVANCIDATSSPEA